MMTDQMIRTIEEALDRGDRVQLKKLDDGTIKIQAIKVQAIPVKELKI